MQIRQVLNRYPGITAGVVLLLIVVATAVIVTQGTGRATVERTFFTNDDGQSWFEDSVKRVAPFDKDGKPAYRAMVVDCGGELSVAWMERYVEKARAVMEKLQANPQLEKELERELAWISQSGIEYKRPGGSDWVTLSSPGSAGVRTLTCPDGSSASIVQP